MRMKALSLALVVIAAAGCGSPTAAIVPAAPAPPPIPSPAPGPVPRQTAALVDALARAGASPWVRTVLALDAYPSIDVPGVVVMIGDEWITAFEFPTAEQSEAMAADISPSGHRVGRGQYFWVSDPHFYRSDRLIVLYVGRSPAMLDLLTNVLGPQFAGR